MDELNQFSPYVSGVAMIDEPNQFSLDVSSVPMTNAPAFLDPATMKSCLDS